MDAASRIERSLSVAVGLSQTRGCPPRLAQAMHHAVFPGGARVRPRLCLAVAAANGGAPAGVAEAAAAAIELLHCASLVHDDLPCFDDAATRRGRPSVHRAFGEPLAVLAGDALIVAAFQALLQGAAAAPAQLPLLMEVVCGAAGVPFGIAAGQAWECEEEADLSVYEQQKTGSLFAAAAVAGAAACGAPAEAWRPFGAALGEAYQVADDLRDALSDAAELGKPVGQDAAHGRPNAVRSFGVAGAVARLRDIAGQAIEAIPPCPEAASLRALVGLEVKRLMPQRAAAVAA
ncbi:geranylgeranyl pyrophosphate synthase [Roseomonas nepalensis]|uniref:Geranylgeranyl pyrophosphate synthase n=1 Tax=Muricoccus nepalensis TaxID=1854500 RepID=A0A502G9W7_9PROT|nr:polyprenyl synthetase family protein [Roseomonas nepalensis]TPG58564.1 geranylgeranyl pyrophosphate synthase [Roseomonas nepalensis]